MKIFEKYINDYTELLSLGDKLYEDLFKNKRNANFFHVNYQSWYTESQALIKFLMPSRIEEFDELYYESKRKTIDSITFGIRDWLLGAGSPINPNTGQKRFQDFEVVVMKLQSQKEILKSSERRFKSSLFDIKLLLQADLLDSEIDSSKELNKKGFVRGAGAIAGVVLESHLAQVCYNHQLTIIKQNPTINDLNQLLKDNTIYETPDWRFIQHLGDLRNLCDHKKTAEPTIDQIEELIKGVEKVTKTIF